ncbi:MAG: hypothetical protein KME25_14070 [Symplocastrum torsivum CPER-KK1]|uniref:Uncharacterized protein n=1 Tax=Symplocastrum torsivum CPER-KK1 TaxID=450513 RepID=A0A951PLT6_9CYAN|nr:hypothetical protein [Symplocastrum torsivum CPER-KK1]
MIQAAALGGVFWFFTWCVMLCYILELNKKPAQNQKTEPLTRVKLINNVTKIVVALFALLPMPIFAQIFDLWVKTYGNIEQSLDLLRTVSNIAVTLAIGGTTTYITYRQYQANRALWQIQLRKDTEEMIEKHM